MPRKGLNIPVMTVLDAGLNIIESEQRALIRHTIQNGKGASSLFVCGTTGEFNRLTNTQRQQLISIGVDEIDAENERLGNDEAVESWVGVTSESVGETLDNLKFAIGLGADMAVVAPMAIADLPQPEVERFFTEQIASVLNEHGSIEIGVYENPEIAAHGDNGGLLDLEIIDRLAKLPFVTCVKASVDRPVLIKYIECFTKNGEMEFPFYFGNAPEIFELSEIQTNAGIDPMPVVVAGVVSGTGNVFPAESRQAWELVIEGRKDEYEPLRQAFEVLVDSSEGYGGSESKLIAGLKYALYLLDVITSPQVASGTPALSADEIRSVTDGLERARSILQQNISAEHLSQQVSESVSLNARR